MNKNYLKQTIIIILIIINLTFLEKKAYAAVDQILNGNFYQNPAELSQIKQMQLLAGNIFTVPQFTFNGITPLGSGSVRSKAHNLLPYLLTAYRFTDRFVFGANLTPSAYGHLKWPLNSIVAESSTETYFLYYRAGIQASYKFSNNLALGMGFNLEYNKLGEIDSLIPNRGNQINKIKGVNYTGDIGLFYKINSRNFLTMVVYTDVNTFANGTSSLNNLIIHNFSMNVTEAAVASIGIQHWINDKWFTESKIYWSGWSIEQNLYLINTTTGTRIIPTKWRNPWSFQINTRYTTSDKV